MDETKIDGIEKYKVESAARTLIEAKEMEGKPKLYAAALKEVARQAKAAEAVALESKVSLAQKKIFRGKK